MWLVVATPKPARRRVGKRPIGDGCETAEGRELNETAREAGDDPRDWFVSEQPVDVMQASEVWTSRSKYKPKLERNVDYLKDVRHMVTLCRTTRAYIPPSWLPEDEAVALAHRMGLPLDRGRGR